MSYQDILFDVRDSVAVITLNRPERLNAFTRQMRMDIFDALDAVRSDSSIRCLMFTGAGRGFCAGADLGDADDRANSDNVDMGLSLEQEYNPLILALRDFSIPTVAAVNGPCAGAGMSLALATDIIIAARSASFLQAFCNIGLVPDAGSSWFLPRQIGRARAAGMALLGERVPAETAADWGLIWQCVDDDALPEAAMAVAGKLANGPTRGLVMIRQALAASQENDLPSQLDLERDLQREAGRTDDFKEGVQAFLEKRPATFKGR
jgi:2-(1,2-epoxy-1,2-dihydrophenyl)acetyl-CoA isomerase